jgi:hypothetical protein
MRSSGMRSFRYAALPVMRPFRYAVLRYAVLRYQGLPVWGLPASDPSCIGPFLYWALPVWDLPGIGTLRKTLRELVALLVRVAEGSVAALVDELAGGEEDRGAAHEGEDEGV